MCCRIPKLTGQWDVFELRSHSNAPRRARQSEDDGSSGASGQGDSGQAEARILGDLADRTAHIFLPKRYKEWVTPEFLPYCWWQFVGSVSGTVTGVLSMQALLFAVGLGSGSVPLAGAINWVLKDGLGQLGGVLYASVMGSHFDHDPKRHRFISALALQACHDLLVLLPRHGILTRGARIDRAAELAACTLSTACKAHAAASCTVCDNCQGLCCTGGGDRPALYSKSSLQSFRDYSCRWPRSRPSVKTYHG